MIIAVSRIGKRPQSGSTDVKIAEHGMKLEDFRQNEPFHGQRKRFTAHRKVSYQIHLP